MSGCARGSGGTQGPQSPPRHADSLVLGMWDLIPGPGVKAQAAFEAWTLSHRTIREAPRFPFYMYCHLGGSLLGLRLSEADERQEDPNILL